jgi:hypothetical protein
MCVELDVNSKWRTLPLLLVQPIDVDVDVEDAVGVDVETVELAPRRPRVTVRCGCLALSLVAW